MNEAGLTTINDQGELDAFLDLVWGFHDALLREVSVLSRGYVDSDGLMYGDTAPCDARLIFHSQKSDTPWIELIFEDVRLFRFKAGCAFETHGTIDQTGVTLQFAEGFQSEGCKLEAGSMKYRIGGTDLLGKEVRTVRPIPREARAN